MGFSKKESALESDGKKWVIVGIPIRPPLKSIKTKAKQGNQEDSSDEGRSTTPTARESRIPEILPCPPAPRKPRPAAASTCHRVGVREYFTHPDLDSVFQCFIK